MRSRLCVVMPMLAVAVLFSAVEGFQPAAALGSSSTLRASPLQMSSRREAVLGLATASAVTALTALPAFADDTDDAIARIAARAKAENAANDAKALKNVKTEEELEEEQEASKRNIGLALLASVGLSVPLYAKNLARLGTKIASGGKDDGYGKYKEEPKKQNLGKSASQFFFKRGYED